MSKLLLPTSDAVVRAVLLRSIEDRMAGRDTALVTPSARKLARLLLSRGGEVLQVDDTVTSTVLDLSGGDVGAAR